jgi:phospho-N-acetylmuramoyl-pentapeptide-transferase
MAEALLLCGLAFLLIVPWGGWVVRELLKRGIGKQIRFDGPASHQVKAGTATMGGLYILAALAIITAILAVAGHKQALLPLVVMLAHGLFGAFDDLQGLADAKGVGWLARYKFPAQWALAIGLALVLFWGVEAHPIVLPVSGRVLEMGWWFVPAAAFFMVAFSNAVNLTDGQDGLAAGTLAIALGAYGVLAGTSAHKALSLFSFALVGVLLAFLWFNAHPAEMFMGDTGSQALGAGLAAVAALSGHWLLLPVIALVPVAEALSVILQVSYFKYSRRRYGEGRRIFRMSPLHHHYELGGYSEAQITARFLLVAAGAAAIGVGLGIGW